MSYFKSREELFNYFNNFLDGYNEIEYNKINLLGESVKFNLFSMFIMSIFGISVIIMPLVPVLVFIKGFVLGFTIGFLVSQFDLQGILIAVVAVFPQNLLVIPCYLLGGLTTVGFSIKIVNYFRSREKLNFLDYFNYISKMVFLGILILGGSLVETYISPFLFKIILKFYS